MERAARLRRLPPYLFVELARAKEKALAEGREIMDLGIGDPEGPTPAPIVDALREASGKPEHHRYPGHAIESAFRREAALWLERRFGVGLDPDSQILPLIGTKEGLGHLPLALVDPGDRVLVPDPAYPVYAGAAILAGGEPVHIPLPEENAFLPRLEDVPRETAVRAKLLYLNYPNNPTAATCDGDFFARVTEWAAAHQVVVAHDAAYNEITFDGYRAPGLLQTAHPDAQVIEFYSFSKTWNMCGWRLGFAAGRPQVVAALRGLKANLDSGVFGAILEAGIRALAEGEGWSREMVEEYRRRRDILYDALIRAGWILTRPRGTFYLWARPPRPVSSGEMATLLLDRLGVVATPGIGFGRQGEGYLRFSLTPATSVVERAGERLSTYTAAELAADACRMMRGSPAHREV